MNLSTSAVVSQSLNLPRAIGPAPASLQLEIKEAFAAKLTALEKKIVEEKKQEELFVKVITLREITAKFEQLNKIQQDKLNAEEKLLIEQYKLAIQKAVLQTLPPGPFESKKIVKPAQPSSLFWDITRKIGLGFLAVFGVTFACADAYVGSTSFFGMIADVAFGGIPDPALIAIGVIFSLTSVFLYYFIEINNIKESLGIDSYSQAKSHLSVYKEQYKTVEHLNNELFNRLKYNKEFVKHPQTQHYTAAVTCFKDDIKNKEKLFLEGDSESSWKRTGRNIARYSLLALGTVLTASTAFFSANIYLGMIGSGVLAGTPLGWVIIGMISVASAAAYLASQSKRFFNIFSANSSEFDELKVKYKEFIDQSPDVQAELEKQQNRPIIQPAEEKSLAHPSQLKNEVGTQTDEPSPSSSSFSP